MAKLQAQVSPKSTGRFFVSPAACTYAPCCLPPKFEPEDGAWPPFRCEPGRAAAAAAANSAIALDVALSLMILRGLCDKGSVDGRLAPLGDNVCVRCADSVWLDCCDWDRGPADGRARGEVELPGLLWPPEGRGLRALPLGSGVFC